MSEEEIKDIPLDLILEPATAARTVIDIDALNEMADSIAEAGVIQNIIVKPRGDKWEIIDGHRRFLGAKMCQLPVLRCVVRDIDDKKADSMMLQANYHREEMNPVDEALNFQRMKDKHGYAVQNVARAVSKSESYVAQRIQLLSADKPIIEALSARKLSVSQAREIMKSPNDKVRLELLRVVLSNGATVSALRTIRADYDLRAGSITQEQAAEIIAPSESAPTQYLIECPCCNERVDVNLIYPLSVCKACHNGILSGIEESKQKK